MVEEFRNEPPQEVIHVGLLCGGIGGGKALRRIESASTRCGAQREAMKPSAFNILVSDRTSGQLAVYNSLWGSLTTFERAEAETVLHALREPANGVPEGLRQLLAAQHHLAPDNEDELQELTARKRASVLDDSILEVVLLPTLDCNFSCAYCYQQRRPDAMGRDVAEGVLQWITHKMPAHEALSLRWFGGEPLLALPLVLDFTRRIRNTAREMERLFLVHMTTNGYLLIPSVAGRLVEAGVTDFQITLDGPPDVHDARRTLRSGGPTFRRVLDNLLSLVRAAPDVSVTLRVNVDGGTVTRVTELLQMVPQQARPSLTLSVEPVFGECRTPMPVPDAPGIAGADVVRLYDTAEAMGFTVVDVLADGQRGVYCSAEKTGQYLVNSNGDLHKCSACEYASRERVGHIATDGKMVIQPEAWNQWVNTEFFDASCRQCRYLPLCMGGCRKTRIAGEGTGSFCRFIPEMIDVAIRRKAFGFRSQDAATTPLERR